MLKVLNSKQDKMSLYIWYIYFFLSYYEGYMVKFIPGGVSKYILIILVCYLCSYLVGRDLYVKIDQILLFIWVLYYCVSILWTPNMAQAKLYIMSVVSMCVLYIASRGFVYSDEYVDKILICNKITSVSMAFLSLFFSTTISAGTRRVLYLWGTYLDPNNQVAFVAIGSALCLYSIFKNTKNIYKILNISGFIICVFSIFQSGSRSGIVVLVAQLFIVIMIPYRNERFLSIIKKIFYISIFLFIGYYFISSYISSVIVDRILGRGDLEFTDGTGRLDMWAISLAYFRQHPLLGNGWGAFESHNTFLTILVDVGILGFSIFIFFLTYLYLIAFKDRNILSILILTSGLLPSFLIGAQNKRFFWNAIILCAIVLFSNNKKRNCKSTKINLSKEHFNNLY